MFLFLFVFVNQFLLKFRNRKKTKMQQKKHVSCNVTKNQDSKGYSWGTRHAMTNKTCIPSVFGCYGRTESGTLKNQNFSSTSDFHTPSVSDMS